MIHKLTLVQNKDIPLRDVVFQTLRSAILTGDFVPGERLMEIPLANTLGVSRTPVREAIHMLELEGLVIISPHRSAEVAGISLEGMKEVLEIRRALDILCVELACSRIDEAGIEELRQACDDFEEATGSGDVMSIASSDVAFHNVIIKATGNSRLESIINNLSEQVYRYRYEYIKDADIYAQLICEHRNIYESIKNRDALRAAQMAGEHIDNQKTTIMNQISLEKSK